MTRKILATAVMAAALATPAFASDTSSRAPYYSMEKTPALFNWTGFYVGANGGYGSTTVDGLKMKGALVGATFGVNLQVNSSPVVFGIEGDWAKSWVKGRLRETFPGETVTFDAKLDSMATLRARAGIAWNRFMVYGTAGVARTQAKAKVTDVFLGVPTVETAKEALTGAAFGGGVEYAINNHWSTKLEYIRANFNDSGDKFHVDLVRAGVNYRF